MGAGVKIPITAMLWAALALAGCPSTSSKDLATNRIYADLSAISDGNSTHAQAVLRADSVSSINYVTLSSGDDLDVTADGASTRLSSEYHGSLLAYAADVGAPLEGTTFTFGLHRASGESALNSQAVLPAALTITAPTSADVSRAQPFTVSWTPSGTADHIAVRITGDCISQYVPVVTGDPGTITLDPGVLFVTGGDNGVSCAGTLTITRFRAGTLDPALGGGTVRGGQARQMVLRLNQ